MDLQEVYRFVVRAQHMIPVLDHDANRVRQLSWLVNARKESRTPVDNR